MCKRTIRDIINENGDLHYIKIDKPTRDRSTWEFEVTDTSSRLCGVSGNLNEYHYKIVTLQRGVDFFASFKIYFDDGTFEYFVDPRKSMHRSSVKSYVEGILNYIIYSNDISYNKNDASFKYTHNEMLRDGVTNFLELCVKYGDYSSIGTGLTRDIRNLIVLDIDVNCEKEDNKKELENLLITFSSYDFVPNFYIINHESKHVQLQWLIQDCEYKRIQWDGIQKKIVELETTKHINKELNIRDFNLTELTQDGMNFRKFTRGLTCLSDKYKFGDKNYTFWKAKNFYSAFLHKYNLELKMPIVEDGEIRYLTEEEMSRIFESKDSRFEYFYNSPTIDDVYTKTEGLVDRYTSTISESSIKKIKDDLDGLFDDTFDLYDFTKDNYNALSRNTFVLNTTRNVTWESMREMNYNEPSDYFKLPQRNQKAFRSKVKKIVKNRFEQEDKKYNGDWPETTNKTKYTQNEFNLTFGTSFEFAVNHFTNTSYDDEDRNKSLKERKLKKELRQTLIIYIQSLYHKIKNKDLLSLVNDMLCDSKHEKISNTTLKRDLVEIKKYTITDKQNLFTHLISAIDDRQKDFDKVENTENKKEINVSKKKLKRLYIKNFDNIRTFINTEGILE